MKDSFRLRNWGIGVGAAVLALAGVAALLLAALDAGYFRPALIRYLEAGFNRQIRIEGPLHLQLWSRHPHLVAQQVTIGNPPWVAPGEMARIGRLTLSYSAPGFGHGAALESVTMEDANLHLLRDAAGRANWQATDPSTTTHSKGMPLIRELSALGVQVLLDDQRRHLQFDGIVSAQGLRQAPAPRRLHIAGSGQLNGRPATFDLSADPLDTARVEVPYAWEFSEESSGSRVQAHGTLPRPLDFNLMNAAFEAGGEDLKDLYFLTGVTLLNTGAYRLTGSIERRAAGIRFTQLSLSTGQSDLGGSVSIETVNGRPHLDALMTANLLRTADFGARAAGRGPPPDSPPRIFSDAAVNPEALRRIDTLLRFGAHRVLVGRMSLQSISGQMKLDRGVVTVTSLTADLLQGKVEARIRLDANKDMPAAEASVRFTDLQLAALDHKGAEAPLEGLMQARVDITGQGRSIQQIAATANGTVSAEIPRGTIRASLAELTGVDLRGLGLTLARSKREAAVRCAAASFRASAGTLTARSFVVDTEPVVITGEGDIRLDTEELDMTLRGQPKDLRLLRLDAPLLVRGTLARPSVAIQTHASSVKLIDTGHAKDVDCVSLLAASRSDR